MSKLYQYEPEAITLPDVAQAQAEAFLKASSPESREVVLKEILKELIALNTDIGYIFLETAEGEDWGVYLPPKAAEAFFNRPGGPVLTPEREAELAERRRHPERAIPIEQAIQDLRREQEALRAEMVRQPQA